MNLEAALAGNAKARVCCPYCGRNDRDRTFGITRNEHGIVGHCFRCETVITERAATLRAPIAPPKAPTMRDTLAPQWRAFWQGCGPIRGSIAETYLRVRGCRLTPADGDLRFHPGAWHWAEKRNLPALVGLLTDATDKTPRSLHFTYLKADGSAKADIKPARLLLAGHRKQGAVIRLWPDETVTTGLGIGEGIETTLALAHAFAPAWSCVDAGNLAAFPVLAGVAALTIAADHDDAGLKAAEACAERWHELGADVHIVVADSQGDDLADEVTA